MTSRFRSSLQNLPGYLRSLRPDLLAGATVALIAIPQAMAYAAIAGVGPLHGLYTAIIPAIVGAALGSSNFVVTGATNAVALATASVLGAYEGMGNYAEYVFALAIVSGLTALVLGVLRLGSITRFVSNSVLTGFLTGAGVLIIINQLGTFFGVGRPRGVPPYQVVWYLVQHIGQLNPYVLVTGVFSIVVLLLLRKLDARIPSALLAIVFAGVLVQLTGWHGRGVKIASDLGAIEQAGLVFHIPDVPRAELQSLIVRGGAVALLSLVERISVAKALGIATGQRVDSSREFVAHGLASIAGGFFKAIPSGGSPSRSAVNYNAGARTRMAASLSGVFVLLAVLAFSRLIGFIPTAALAGVVIVSAYKMIDRHHIKLTWQSRWSSRIVLSVTFLSTLVLPLHLAIYLGAFLSIGIYLYQSSHLKLTYLTQNGDGSFTEHNLAHLLEQKPEIAIVNVEGALYFAAVDDLEVYLDRLIEAGIRVIVLRLRRVRLIASTGVTALEGLIRYARQQGTSILLCGVSDKASETLTSSGVQNLLGEEHIFSADRTLFASTQAALDYAHELLDQSR